MSGPVEGEDFAYVHPRPMKTLKDIPAFAEGIPYKVWFNSQVMKRRSPKKNAGSDTNPTPAPAPKFGSRSGARR